MMGMLPNIFPHDRLLSQVFFYICRTCGRIHSRDLNIPSYPLILLYLMAQNAVPRA